MAGRLRCKKCKRRFTPARATVRVYCFECRPPRTSSSGTLATAPPRSDTDGPGPIESATKAELEAADRLSTVAGQVAVRLARDLDSAALTGSQAASVGDRLLKVMASATAGVPAEPDEIDEFRAQLSVIRDSA